MNNYDVTMPEGITFVLVIDTSAYAGNFEREITGYACGYYDGVTHGEKEAKLFAEEEGELGQRLMNKQTTVKHDSYGHVGETIRATPNRFNNGNGVHADGDPNSGYPAYESVAVFFSDALSAAEIAMIKRRAIAYAANPKAITGDVLGTEPFEIIDVYQVRTAVKTMITEERIADELR